MPKSPPLRNVLLEMLAQALWRPTPTRNLRALPVPKKVVTAETSGYAFLEFSVRPGPKGYALVFNPSRTLTGEAISILNLSTFGEKNDGEEAVNLADIFADVANQTATLIVRKREIDLVPFIEHIDREIAREKPSSTRRKLLEEYRQWATDHQTTHSYELAVITNGEFTIPIPGQRQVTSALNGTIVEYHQAAELMRQWVLGFPLTWEKSDYSVTTQITGPNGEPLVQTKNRKVADLVVPDVIHWKKTYFAIPSNMTAYSGWEGELTPENVDAVLDACTFLVVHTDLLGNQPNPSSLAVLTAEFNEGIAPDFTDNGKALSRAKFTRIVGKARQKHTFKTLMPGGAAPEMPTKWMHPDTFLDVLGAISARLKPNAEPHSQLVVGFDGDTPIAIDIMSPKGHPSVYVEGKSKESGKTTTVSSWVHSLTDKVVMISFSTEEFQSAPVWMPESGGSVEVCDLPDAFDEIEAYRKLKPELQSIELTPAMVKAYQEKLHLKDKAKAEKSVQDLFARMVRGERAFPFTFHAKQDTTRQISYYNNWINSFKLYWKKWYAQSGEVCLFVADNFSNLLVSEEDQTLGMMPKSVRYGLGGTISRWTSNCFNDGVRLFVLDHLAEETRNITAGFDKKFSLKVELRKETDGTRHGRIWIPGNPAKLLYPDFITDLPDLAAAHFGRQK